MKYWFDTEFNEQGPYGRIDLISIGIVAEDGRELYLQSTEVSWSYVGSWIKENVVPQLYPCACFGGLRVEPYYVSSSWQLRRHKHIEPCVWRSTSQIADEIQKFCEDKPEFWGYYCAYDWVMLCKMFDTMMMLPKGWSKHCSDIKQWCNALDNQKLPNKPEGAHNALVDAHWNKEAWSYLSEIQKQRDEQIEMILTRLGYPREAIDG
jgi:hypothetical protein